MNGTLGDGTPLIQKAAGTSGNAWPFHSRLYENAGALLGWARHGTNNGAFNGDLYWFKPSRPLDTRYAGGFTNTITWIGAPYSQRDESQKALAWTNGTIVLQGGNLPRPFIYRVVLEDDDSFSVVLGPSPLNAFIDRVTGHVNGSFIHPALQVETPFEGIIVQGAEEGGGMFYGLDQTGAFTIQKQ
jgi:hypothetical protein